MKLMLTSYFPFVDTKENEGGDKVGSDISTKIQEVIATIRSNLSVSCVIYNNYIQNHHNYFRLWGEIQ